MAGVVVTVLVLLGFAYLFMASLLYDLTGFSVPASLWLTGFMVLVFWWLCWSFDYLDVFGA